jgi:hypothetical protein
LTTFVLVNSWLVNRIISEILEFILFPPLFSLFRDLTEQFFCDFDLLLWLICRFLECFWDPCKLLFISWFKAQLLSPKLQSPKVLISSFFCEFLENLCDKVFRMSLFDI